MREPTVKSSSIRPIHDDIAVVGWACRLPGANSIEELWSLLIEGRCSVTQVPEERFARDRFLHPRRQERGKTYTWAAGVLDDIWGFDPAAFGISPREAVQIDPQQRLLLELTWEALEDAGIPPSSIAGTEVGVFVGGSQSDYGHAFLTDAAIADGHFGTGTALSILSNRISYVFGLHGPSLTVDTACSSSLVALHQAMHSLRSGRIDTAIVAGSNLIASPASFIAFSQANMLSPTGRCRAFSADADGFVRAEGAVVLVLRKASLAHGSPIHGTIVASDVNSDGRTNGIALPSLEAQQALLGRVYQHGGIDASRLAFVEAHGTGTPVGDPIEATAIGRMIGQRREGRLPIGSLKTNIGHLEPASGIAGVVKALLALNRGILPPSLHSNALNPYVSFDDLNLSLCTQPLLLPRAADQLAGVNSFGFGGTNAHVVVGPGRRPAAVPHGGERPGGFFAISAHSAGALKELARDFQSRIGEQQDTATAAVAAAIAHRRDRLSHRLVITDAGSKRVVDALGAFLVGATHPRLTVGTAVGRDLPVAFVYSGNGGQRVGMGRSAHRNNAAFREKFDEVDRHFRAVGGWSLREALFSELLHERLPQTSVAQPLIFAIQVASTAALADAGIAPSVVLGHSVGEVAAAEAAGAFDLATAVKVIHARSKHQERCRGAGRMAAVLAPAEAVEALLDEIPGAQIAALNGPRMVTIAGPGDRVEAFRSAAKQRGIATLDLGLDYPFHTELMDAIREPLEEDLRDVRARDGTVPFVSAVTGGCIPGSRLNGTYWWRNVREPVRFSAAIRAAAELGARYFVEIGPRATLVQHLTDTLKGEVAGISAVAPLGRGDEEDGDPFAAAAAHALVAGAKVATGKLFGPDPGPDLALPRYPWQRTPFRFEPTVESLDSRPGTRPHRYAGSRTRVDSVDWRGWVDTVRQPELADHRLGDQPIFPGTGFIEILLSVGREWLGSDRVGLTGVDIVHPLDLSSENTHEILTRFSTGSNTLELLSRPRLSEAGWVLHCRCKLSIAAGDPHLDDAAEAPRRPAHRSPPTDAADAASRVLGAEEIYQIATASGLNYGPAFRLVTRVVTAVDGSITVDLTAPDGPSQFTLDPMRVDCCAHGLFTLFPQLRAVERGVTYVPVRVDEVSLLRAGVAPVSARIQVLRTSERTIVCDSQLIGADGEVVATLRGVRSQAVPMRRIGSLDSVSFVEVTRLADGRTLSESGPLLAADDIRAGLASFEAAGASDADMLLDGWALAQGAEIAASIAYRGRVDMDAVFATRRLPEHLRPWFLNVLNSLAGAGLAKHDGATWKLQRNASLPRAASVLAALIREHPARATELLLAGAVARMTRDFAAAGQRPVADPGLPATALDFHHLSGASLRDSAALVRRLLLEDDRLWPGNRALRVLLVGHSPLARSFAESERDIILTVFEPDRRRHAGAEVALGRLRRVRLLGSDQGGELGEYDLIVAMSSLHRLPEEFTLARLRRALAADGLLVAAEPTASLFKDLVFGIQPGWFRSGDGAESITPLRSPEQWRRALSDAGFREPSAALVQTGMQNSTIIVAAAPTADATDGQTIPGAETLFVTDADAWPTAEPSAVVFMPDVAHGVPNAAAALTARCLGISACAERIGNRPATLWLAFHGALAAGDSRVHPVETGAWAFSRTLANEYPLLTVRRVDFDSRLSPDARDQMMQRIIRSGTGETELHASEGVVRAVRVSGLSAAWNAARQPDGSSTESAARLERRATAGQRVMWQPTDRIPPGSGEVEIEVEATGVNFRDVMWSLSLLPEDMLEHGFSGATLGLECAGRIARVGDGVRDRNVGDPVMAFAASAFATHVTVKGDQTVLLPAGMSFEAAATIPVAFFTAYYGLVTQAQLKRGEWVLVHGGAGAVGLAAIQIARARGAKIIATAGSPAKRELLRSMGVPHVLDSRSLAFAQGVRELTGDGVDVVLNSLAGEAMERSLACLRPFGRFVELGKRDYVTDTHVGLRPFRRNLTYFGVDVDQVIGAHKGLGRRVFAKIIDQFAKGTYTPLPYTVFDASSVASAFQLMQQAGHIGKLVVTPPRHRTPSPTPRPFTVSTTGTHVVTGAFGGFGLETARWLVDKGARHLVLLGRRGPASDEARAALTEFSRRGVSVVAQPCDVADRNALTRLFAELGTSMPPLAGVMHAAMVLDDGALANLDAGRFERVLAPKVTGTANLEHLVRGARLDYFVLFSSVTTLIGNPGQANYVAANGYMEGVARRRRQDGLPAIAIGWGPITDVGVVAKDERLRAGLQRLGAGTGLRAREALALLEQALGQPTAVPHTAVITIAPVDSGLTPDRLAVLGSPTYEAYVSDRKRPDGDGTVIDLRAIVARDGVEAARQKAAEVISEEVAHVLRLGEGEISQVRPLSEIGLDSLMAIELVLGLEERFGQRMPLSGTSGGMTIDDIADQIVAQLGADRAQGDATIAALAKQHLAASAATSAETTVAIAAERTRESAAGAP